ncbi:MAG: RNB domain-containing ribonuclease [Bacilli bacterium]
MSDNIRELYKLIKNNISYDEIKSKLSEKAGQQLTNKSMFNKLITLLENLIASKNNNLEQIDYYLILDYITMSLKEKDVKLSIVIQRFEGLKKKITKTHKPIEGLSLEIITEKLIDIRLKQLKQANSISSLFEVFLNCGDIDFVKYLIKNRPDIVNIRDNNNEHIFNYVIDKYLNLTDGSMVKNIDSMEEYLRNLIFLFLESPNISFDKYDIEMITSIIDNNRIMLKGKNHICGEKIFYLLNKIEEDLKSYKIDFNEISDCLSSISCKRVDSDINRRSLKNIYTIAIDKSRKSRSEDALSLVYSNHDKCYTLMFHIADLSNISAFDTLLDKRARSSGESFFRDVDKINNMIDRGIVNRNYFDINKKTPAITFIVKVDSTGEILTQNVIKSKIVLNKKICFREIGNIIKCQQQEESRGNTLGELLVNANNLAKIINEKKNEEGKLKYNKNSESNMIAVLTGFINYVASDICLKNNIPFIADIKGVKKFNDSYGLDYFMKNKDLIKQLLISENIELNRKTLKYRRYCLYSTRINKTYSGISGKWTSPFRFYAGLLNFWIMHDLLLNNTKNYEEVKERWERRIFYIAPKENAILFYNNCFYKKELSSKKPYCKVTNN